jgi:hypothetical protein
MPAHGRDGTSSLRKNGDYERKQYEDERQRNGS